MIPNQTTRSVQRLLPMATMAGAGAARRLAGPPVAATARTVEVGLVKARRWLGRVLDHAQLALKGLETHGDPDDVEWVSKTLASVKDGSVERELAKQPTPEQVVAEWRSSRIS